jgi:mannose-6-phosphate isomerase
VGRPWGGGRFGGVDGEPVGELWVSGDLATLPDGRTLAEAGLALSVPLVKILDIAGRLSVQVHPDDRLAGELHGHSEVGKHEAWYVLDAAGNATIEAGLASGAGIEDLFSGDDERVFAALARRPATVGSIVDVPPGVVHSPGPGLLLYEVQQRSDRTYRIWDWGRSRPLHLAEARRAVRAQDVSVWGPGRVRAGRFAVGAKGAPFTIGLCRLAGSALRIDLARPTVLSSVSGWLEVDDTALPPGSHWLVGAGQMAIGGNGEALLAAWR